MIAPQNRTQRGDPGGAGRLNSPHDPQSYTHLTVKVGTVQWCVGHYDSRPPRMKLKVVVEWTGCDSALRVVCQVSDPYSLEAPRIELSYSFRFVDDDNGACGSRRNARLASDTADTWTKHIRG